MNITTHGGTTDASDKQPSVVTIGSKDGLSAPDLNDINEFLKRMLNHPSRLGLTGATCAMILAEQGNLKELRQMINQALSYERGFVDEKLSAPNIPS